MTGRMVPVRDWSCSVHDYPPVHECDCEFCDRPVLPSCCEGAEWRVRLDEHGEPVMRELGMLEDWLLQTYLPVARESVTSWMSHRNIHESEEGKC